MKVVKTDCINKENAELKRNMAEIGARVYLFAKPQELLDVVKKGQAINRLTKCIRL